MNRILIALTALLLPTLSFGQKITNLPAATDAADGDLIEIVDVSDTSTAATGRNEKASILVLKDVFQPKDADLTTYSGITPSANVQTLLGAADFAAFKVSLSLGNVENTAISTFAGSSNITTLGTIGTGVWNGTIIGPTYLGTGSSITTKYLRGDGTWQTISGGGDALTSGNLSQFAATTSAQLSGVLSDEVGTGEFVLDSVTDALDTRLDTVEADLADEIDFGAATAISLLAVDENDDPSYVDTSAEMRLILTDESGTGAALFAGGNIGAADATSPDDGDSDTSVATTEFVQNTAKGSQGGLHSTPVTTNPLTLTWTAVMHTLFYGATGEIDLPAAAGYTGRAVVVYNTGAFTITLDPNASEVIVRDGAVQTGGVTFTLSSGAGNYVALISDGERWITLGYKGTLTVGS